MSRRPHRKSRNGCSECKRRHIRVCFPHANSLDIDKLQCDENRPACTNCVKAEMRCSFLSPNEPLIIPTCFSGAHNPEPFPAQELAALRREVSTPGSDRTSTKAAEAAHCSGDFDVNMIHMRLMHNFQNQAFLEANSGGRGDIPPTVYYKHALKTPYIMHACLAASAMHLATQDSDHTEFYRRYSAGLQHSALSLFNKAYPILDVTAENCETLFLWSSLVGVHVLSETILFERDSLQTFIERFVSGVKLHRGILTIIDQCRDLLFATETGSYLQHSGDLLRSVTSTDGHECEHLKEMLDIPTVSQPVREQCLAAILELQHIFNAHHQRSNDQGIIALIFAWPFLITEEFVQLLQGLQPQALIIFAQYGVLLHRARKLWLIGDGGQYLIQAVSHWVNPDLERYLRPAMAEVETGLQHNQ